MKRRKAILERHNGVKYVNDVSTLFRSITTITASRTISMTKKQAYFEARDLCMFVLRVKYGKTLAEIGRIFHLHHSSVYCAINKIQGFIDFDKHYCEDYREILELLN